MNRYIRKSLEPGERIAYDGKLHWSYVFTYNAWAFVLLALSVAASVWNYLNEEPSRLVYYLAAALLGLAIVVWATGRVVRTRKEFVVTATRFIQKDGILNIHLKEIPLFKVETVNYHQTFFQRIIGTGGIELVGSGGTYHHIDCIANPMEVRRAIVSAINQCNKAGAEKELQVARARTEQHIPEAAARPVEEEVATPPFRIDINEEEENS